MKKPVSPALAVGRCPANRWMKYTKGLRGLDKQAVKKRAARVRFADFLCAFRPLFDSEISSHLNACEGIHQVLRNNQPGGAPPG